MRALVSLVSLIVLTGCSSSILLSSAPPEVTVYDGDQAIGKTPLEIAPGDLKSEVGDGYLLRMEKEGYEKVWFWFPGGVRGLEVNLNLRPFFIADQLQPPVPTAIGVRTVEQRLPRNQLDQLAARLLRIQQGILSGAAADQGEIDDIITAYPRLAPAYYVKALAQLVDGDQDGAIGSLQQAANLAPEEPDYVALLQDLGGDVSAIEPETSEVETEGGDDDGT